MSFTITTDVFCDGCGIWVHGACGGRVLKQSAMRVAKQQGWIAKFGKQYCPDCKVKSVSPKEKAIK